MKKPNLLSRMGLAITRARNFVINAIFLLLVAAAVVGLIQGLTESKVPDSGALVIDPAGVLVEEARPEYNLLGLVSQSEPLRQTSVSDLLKAVDHAADDDRIRAIVLRLDDLISADSAHARQLGKALERFKAAGKEVIAFGQGYGQGQYAIASFADAIYMHPFGHVSFPGYGRYSPYFKGLLEKIGVNVHLFRVGKYKEAAEPFIREDMSPEAREVNQ
ncbi:MAG: S49 family peptidase, partial [Gammaproteobacteria bacterium]|nr:S49 family peptidase [Gammaproteobacteria bacterium]